MTTINVLFINENTLTHNIVFSVSSLSDLEMKLENVISLMNKHLTDRYKYKIKCIDINYVEYMYYSDDAKIIYPVEFLENEITTFIYNSWEELQLQYVANDYDI